MPRAWSRVAVTLAAALASCRTAAPPLISRVPDPLTPPVAGGPLMSAQAEAVRAAVAAAERGDFGASEEKLREIPPGHPVWAFMTMQY